MESHPRKSSESVAQGDLVPYSKAIPRPTWGPLASALGVALLAAGLVTDLWVLVGGAVIAVIGLVAWAREVFPQEQLEEIPQTVTEVDEGNFVVASVGAKVHRPIYPAQIRPYASGVVGGLLGGVAMAIVASIWGVVNHESPWMPINLLSGAVIPAVGAADLTTLELFNAEWFATALVIHVALSIGVGLLYTTALPMMPDRPILAGGVLVPVIATSLVWASLGIVNPALEQHISWPWFLGSQLAFGMVCGWWVGSRAKVAAMVGRSIADRLHIERGGE